MGFKDKFCPTSESSLNSGFTYHESLVRLDHCGETGPAEQMERGQSSFRQKRLKYFSYVKFHRESSTSGTIFK